MFCQKYINTAHSQTIRCVNLDGTFMVKHVFSLTVEFKKVDAGRKGERVCSSPPYVVVKHYTYTHTYGAQTKGGLR